MSGSNADDKAQAAVDKLTSGMSEDEAADLIREAAPELSEAEVQAWAKRGQK